MTRDGLELPTFKFSNILSSISTAISLYISINLINENENIHHAAISLIYFCLIKYRHNIHKLFTPSSEFSINKEIDYEVYYSRNICSKA